MVGVKKEDIDYLKTNLKIYPLNLKPITPSDIEKVRIVQIAQHPGGKQTRFSPGLVCGIQEIFILYEADTAAGSSGSPVFFVRNEACHVLALHKSGGATTTRRKEPANVGIFINVILDHVNGSKFVSCFRH